MIDLILRANSVCVNAYFDKPVASFLKYFKFNYLLSSGDKARNSDHSSFKSFDSNFSFLHYSNISSLTSLLFTSLFAIIDTIWDFLVFSFNTLKYNRIELFVNTLHFSFIDNPKFRHLTRSWHRRECVATTFAFCRSRNKSPALLTMPKRGFQVSVEQHRPYRHSIVNICHFDITSRT